MYRIVKTVTIFTTYDTFCIQENVFIYPGTWYQVELSNTVGPYSPSATGDGPLNGAVDYLFYQYETGAYDTSLNGSNSLQADLQNLLWYSTRRKKLLYPGVRNPLGR